jgi:hypothetical protein
MKCYPREMLVESQRIGDSWGLAGPGQTSENFRAEEYVFVTLTTTATDRPKTYLTIPVRKGQLSKYPGVGSLTSAEIFLR